jgi:hypothetical protein
MTSLYFDFLKNIDYENPPLLIVIHFEQSIQETKCKSKKKKNQDLLCVNYNEYVIRIEL